MAGDRIYSTSEEDGTISHFSEADSGRGSCGTLYIDTAILLVVQIRRSLRHFFLAENKGNVAFIFIIYLINTSTAIADI